jgi:hypothetical protein
MPYATKAPGPSRWLTSHPKFWPKNPVTKVNGRKTVARMVSCSTEAFCRTLTNLGLLDRDHGHVGLEHCAEQVALGDDLLVDQQQVVLDVPDIRVQLRGFGGALDGGDHGQQGWTAR